MFLGIADCILDRVHSRVFGSQNYLNISSAEAAVLYSKRRADEFARIPEKAFSDRSKLNLLYCKA